MKQIGIYLTETENQLVQENARKAGLGLSVYAREIVLQGHLKTRLSEEERWLFRGLVEASNDLHRMVKMAQESGLSTVLSSFEAYRNRIDNLLNKHKL